MDLYKKIIDECSQHQNVERIILYLNNEPLLDPAIVERIDYAKQKVPWSSVHILTNGSLLNDTRADKLIQSKLDWIGISFHGIQKETIEKAMGINFETAFKRICQFIQKVDNSEKNLKDYIMITFLKHPFLSNKEKQDSFDFWHSKGIERISYFDGPVSRAGNVKQLKRVYHKSPIIGCNTIWTKDMIHVVEDGTVILCCMDWNREVVLGDLKKESISSVWNNERRRIWLGIEGKKRLPEDFLCKKCEAAILKAANEPVKEKTRDSHPTTVRKANAFRFQLFLRRLGLKRFFDGFYYFKLLEYPLVYNNLCLKENEAYLDVGSGKSIFPLFVMVKNKCAVHIVDDQSIIEDSFKYYHDAVKKMGLAAAIGKKIIIHRLNKGSLLNFPDNSFDKISCISTLEHIKGSGDTVMMRKLSKILKPGGILAISFPFNSGGFIEESAPEGVGYFQRQYNYSEIKRRIIDPSGLQVRKVIYFGERYVSIGRRYLKKKFEKVKWLLPVFSNFFWRVCHQYEGDFRNFHDGALDKKNAGVVCIILIKRDK